MQTLNYSTQCIEDWKHRYLSLPANEIDPQFRTIIQELSAVLASAPKFQLPDGGRPITDEKSVSRMFSSLKLPFPCVVLEFVSTGPVGEKEIPSGKRISVAWDLQQGCPEIFHKLTGTRIANPTGMLVQSISYLNNRDAWVPILGMLQVRTDRQVEDASLHESENEFLMELISHRLQKKTSSTYPVQSYATHSAWFENPETSENWESILIADSSDEVLSAVSFAALTACANVTSDIIKAPVMLNKKRLAKNKTPFFDVRILTVADDRYIAPSPSGSASETKKPGGHASPRTHLRRGHIRKLDTKAIWVNAAVVNPQSAIPAAPTYKVSRQQ